MTSRSNFQHWILETKVRAMTWMAGRLFTFKQTGLDGFLKRTMLKKPKPGGGRR